MGMDIAFQHDVRQKEVNMSMSANSFFDGEHVHGELTVHKKGHRVSRWRRRFIILAIIAICSNLALLFGIAYSYYTPSRAFTLTKEDLRNLLTILPGNINHDALRAGVKRLNPELEIRDKDKQMSVGGFSFYFDDDGQLLRIEHWAIDQHPSGG